MAASPSMTRPLDGASTAPTLPVRVYRNVLPVELFGRLQHIAHMENKEELSYWWPLVPSTHINETNPINNGTTTTSNSDDSNSSDRKVTTLTDNVKPRLPLVIPPLHVAYLVLHLTFSM
jgi:hypothetical protein